MAAVVLAPPAPRGLMGRIGDAYRAYRTRRANVPMGEVSTADPYSLYGGRSLPYNPSELVSVKGYHTLDQMRRDDQVKAALAFKKQSVLAAGWRIAAPEGKADDWDVKVEVERALYHVDGGFARALREVMVALDFGFSVSEKVWEEVDGKARLKKLATRKPYDIMFITDKHGNLQEVTQNSKALPLDKLVIYTYDYEFSNYYGRSDLEAAYRAWWTKNNAYKWMAMMLERLGIPPIFALYNHNVYTPEQRTKLQEVLKSMQAATVGGIPRPSKDDLEMWAPELAGQVGTVFLPAMEFFNKDISRALLMPGLLGLTQDDKQGSLARSQVHFDVFMLVLEDIRTQLEELVNEQVIDDILAFNFGEMEEDEKPRFEFMPLSDDVRLDILERWTAMVAGGVVLPQDADETHIRTMLKFPELDESAVEERATRGAELAQVLMPESIEGEEVPEEEQSAEMKEFAVVNNGVWIKDAQGKVVCIDYAGWDEAKHPRHGAGSAKGGEFAPSDIDEYGNPSTKARRELVKKIHQKWSQIAFDLDLSKIEDNIEAVSIVLDRLYDELTPLEKEIVSRRTKADIAYWVGKIL